MISVQADEGISIFQRLLIVDVITASIDNTGENIIRRFAFIRHRTLEHWFNLSNLFR